jgi:hypothetical protein
MNFILNTKEVKIKTLFKSLYLKLIKIIKSKKSKNKINHLNPNSVINSYKIGRQQNVNLQC